MRVVRTRRRRSPPLAQSCSADRSFRPPALEQVTVALFMKFTGQPQEVIEEMMDRDCYISATRAVELGFIDGVI